MSNKLDKEKVKNNVTSEKAENNSSDRIINRRDFLRIAGAFGMTAALTGLLAACSSPTFLNVKEEAKKASDNEKQKTTKADYVMRFSVDGSLNRYPDGPITKSAGYLFGLVELKEAIERNTKGRVAVEIHPDAVLGSQADAGKKVQQGILEVATISTQTAAVLAPVWNVLDVPYNIGPVDNFLKVIYSKEVNDSLREKSKELGLIPTIIFPQPRWLQLRKGLKEVHVPDDIAGLKIRVTGSKFEQEAFKILPSNPTPLAWAEVYTSLNEGTVDASHVGFVSILDHNIHKVLGQTVDLEFMYNSDAHFMSTKIFNKYPKDIQDAIMESIYEAQVYIHDNFNDLIKNQIGVLKDSPNVGYKNENVNITYLTDPEREAWREVLKYENNKKVYDQMLDQYGRKEFEIVQSVASSGGSVEQKRWWK